MTEPKQVDFYLLATTSYLNSLDFVCRLAGKAYQQGHQISILVPEPALAKTLDQKLWAEPPTSFIPHILTDHHQVLIKRHAQQAIPIILNLNPSILDKPHHWQRLLQIVPNNQPLLQQARQLYRHYQGLQYSLNSYNLRQRERIT